jgi:glutathione S-transferase
MRSTPCERQRAKPWIMGDAFTMADCAAAPALFYANMVMPSTTCTRTQRRIWGACWNVPPSPER